MAPASSACSICPERLLRFDDSRYGATYKASAVPSEIACSTLCLSGTKQPGEPPGFEPKLSTPSEHLATLSQTPTRDIRIAGELPGTVRNQSGGSFRRTHARSSIPFSIPFAFALAPKARSIAAKIRSSTLLILMNLNHIPPKVNRASGLDGLQATKPF